MLAAGLFKVWMVPPIMVFIAGWIFLGGYLFQKSLLKHSGQRRVNYGTGVLTAFLSGLVGAMPAMIALWAGLMLGASTSHRLVFLILGAAAGAITFTVVGYLVVLTMFKKLSAKAAFSVSLMPLVVIIALGGAVAVGCGVPAYFQKQKENRMNEHANETYRKLSKIHDILFRKFATNPPKTLGVLVEQKLLSKDDITSPAKPDGKGFFYHPPVKILFRPGDNPDEVLVCDFSENFDGESYVVVYTYGKVDRLGQHAFKAVLDRPVNKEFAEAFRKADIK